MLLGFAVTEHCNLRCPHCIRDDVTTVRSLDPELLLATVDQARVLFGELAVTMTGGEPTLHPQWERIVAGLHARGVPYRFVTNGWHMRRVLPSLERHPPAFVRLSLSGADEATHDAERGRGSFRRVLLAAALLTSRGIPSSLSLLLDRRTRLQLRPAVELAEALGCAGIFFTPAQPVGGSAERGTDLSPTECFAVRDEVLALAAEGGRRTQVALEYGAPFGQGVEEFACDQFALRRVYVDARGRLSVCCQLSEYGFNEADVVADLNQVPLLEAWPRYAARLEEQREKSRPRGGGDVFDAFPCIRCARSLGKMQWIRQYPQSPWHQAALPQPVAPRSLVALSYRGRSAQPV